MKKNLYIVILLLLAIQFSGCGISRRVSKNETVKTEEEKSYTVVTETIAFDTTVTTKQEESCIDITPYGDTLPIKTDSIYYKDVVTGVDIVVKKNGNVTVLKKAEVISVPAVSTKNTISFVDTNKTTVVTEKDKESKTNWIGAYVIIGIVVLIVGFILYKKLKI